MSIGMVGGLDQKGLLNQPYTDFPTSNDYVLKTAQPHPNEFPSRWSNVWNRYVVEWLTRKPAQLP